MVRDAFEVFGLETAPGVVLEAPHHRAGVLDEPVDETAHEERHQASTPREAATDRIHEGFGWRWHGAGRNLNPWRHAVEDAFLDLLLDGFLEGFLLLIGRKGFRLLNGARGFY